ncbi:uncharacterized protein LOC110117541 [Ceratitis capitata]|uniref:uncharacterized protein LOC110117541 n=1 Tax=Ceratitis capitata TaxID=7213 RepID=UPI000A11D771|nr:uncharacterized protein LOC110117541 [Ceratitis capitata]
MVLHGDTYAVLRNIDMITEGVTEESLARSDKLLSTRDNIRGYLEKAHYRNEHRYNLRTLEIKYNVGQEVLRKNFAHSNMAKHFNAKLAKTFLKARVREILSSSYYSLEDLEGKSIGTYDAKDMQPC